MKTRLLTLLTVVVCSTMFGCRIDGAFKSKHFVQVYVIPNELRLREVKSADTYVIGVDFFGEYAGGEQKEELARRYNDLSYNRKLVPSTNQALSDPLSWIDVTCDRDFDEEHLANESLGDIVMFKGASPYDFIQRGYKTAPGTVYAYEEILMPLNEVNVDNSKMLVPWKCHLNFLADPATAGEYLFTVTVQVGENELSADISHTF